METGSAQKTNTEHRAKKTQRTEQKNDHTEGGTDRKSLSLKIQTHKNKNKEQKAKLQIQNSKYPNAWDYGSYRIHLPPALLLVCFFCSKLPSFHIL